MTNYEITELERIKFEEIIGRIESVLGDAKLPEAAQVRAETDVPELTEEQVSELYSIMAELGFGRDTDVSLAESGMVGAAVNIEGGKPNKIEAELRVALAADHGPIVLTASSDRRIGDDEKTMLGLENKTILTELESSIIVASRMPGFELLDEPSAVNFGYDAQTKETVSSSTGQASLIGHINGQPVYALEVTRHYKEDGKYVQPNAGELTLLTSQLLEATGVETSKVATVTGGLYGPTRAWDIMEMNKKLAGSGNTLVVGMAAYGRNTMGAVTGTEPALPNLVQLISEISRLRNKVVN